MAELPVPSAPTNYSVTHFHVFKRERPDRIEANMSLLLKNHHISRVPIPPLAFVIYVPNCVTAMNPITIGRVEISAFQIEPQESLVIGTKLTITHISDELSTFCPESGKSPLDQFMESIFAGNETTIYAYPDVAYLPSWISEITQEMGPIPIPFLPPGHDRLGPNPIRKFKIDHLSFDFPASTLIYQSSEAQPRLSCSISVIVDLPTGIDLPLDIPQIQPTAYLFYEGQELGYLQSNEWQDTTLEWKTRFLSFELRSDIHKAPLVITSEEVFGRVMRKYIFRDQPIILGVRAYVDAQVALSRSLEITLNRIPANTQVVLHRE